VPLPLDTAVILRILGVDRWVALGYTLKKSGIVSLSRKNVHSGAQKKAFLISFHRALSR
jgi:hypothetical protein